MDKPTRVLAALGDGQLRSLLQRRWRNNGFALCGVYSTGGSVLNSELARLRPDVVLVDMEVDGSRDVVEAAAKRLRLPVVALVRPDQDASVALSPLEWGAVTLAVRDSSHLDALVPEIEASIKDVHGAQVLDLLENSFPLSGAFPSSTVFDLRRALRGVQLREKIVVVAAGVGGPLAVRRILSEMKGAPVCPIVYSQVLSDRLIDPLIPWLQQHCGYDVVRARDGAKLDVGHVYVVSGRGEEVRVCAASSGSERVLAVQPCDQRGNAHAGHFDTLLQSVADTYRDRSVGVLLSGRGRDGIEGLAALRRAGSFTMVQDRASSLVFELPGQARDAGGAVECLPINEIAARIRMLMRPELASQS